MVHVYARTAKAKELSAYKGRISGVAYERARQRKGDGTEEREEGKKRGGASRTRFVTMVTVQRECDGDDDDDDCGRRERAGHTAAAIAIIITTSQPPDRAGRVGSIGG